MNDLIFGRDHSQNIVNITLKNEKVFIYRETKDGVTVESFDYSPWVLSARPVKNTSERLKGDQYWKYITPTTVEKFQALQEKFQRDLWLPRNIEECFTLECGYTYFKGMKVPDVSILAFDIETSGLVQDSTSQVYLISNTYRKGDVTYKKLFSVDDYADQQDMIENWCYWVREIDPSVLCGHNVLSYDLPYLTHCFGRALPLGRDGSSAEIAERPSQFRKDGSQKYTYHNMKVTGREIIDTFFLSIKYDIAREFPSYGLKAIVKHLGLEKPGRTFIDAGRIREYRKNPEMWAKVKAYAEDDSEDALKLFDLMIPAYFYFNQAVPKTFQQMINEATGAQLDALMVRSYLQDGYSQPQTSGKVEFEGAISMGAPGVYKHVKKVDVASLYPSIMLEYNIHDSKKDPNNHLIQILEYFRAQRLENKRLAKETGNKYYDDLQNSQKLALNSMYGFLGTKFLLYNYPAGAAEVTRRGREVLLKGVEWATGHTLVPAIKEVVNAGTEDEEIHYEWVVGQKVCEGKGYTLANTDTDSFSVTNGQPVDKAEFKTFINELNSLYPELIQWTDDGVYEKVIVIRAKNYVLVKDGKVKIKGSAITDQKKEPALTEMLKNMVTALLDDEPAALPGIYRNCVREAVHIKDISRWATKKTVTKSVLAPNRLTEEKILNAINECIDTGLIEGIQEGDKVWLYSAIEGQIQARAKGELVFFKDGRPKMIDNCILRDVRLWKGDQDVMHYVERVYKTVEILANVVDMSQFIDYGLKSNREALNSLTNGVVCDRINGNGPGRPSDLRSHPVCDSDTGHAGLPSGAKDVQQAAPGP